VPEATTSPIAATWPRRNFRNAASPAGVSSDRSGLFTASMIFIWMSLSFRWPSAVVARAVSRLSANFCSASLRSEYRAFSSSCSFLTASAVRPDCCSSVGSGAAPTGAPAGALLPGAAAKYRSLEIGCPFLSK
jgi:hypothetical protein